MLEPYVYDQVFLYFPCLEVTVKTIYLANYRIEIQQVKAQNV